MNDFPPMNEVWQIHGRIYDLQSYMKRHPGGEEILKQTKGQGDLTALFETYHAFSDITSIQEILQKFEVPTHQPHTETFDFTSYRQLAQQVFTLLSDKSLIKAPLEWYWMVGMIACVFLATFSLSMFIPQHSFYPAFQQSTPLPLSWTSLDEQVTLFKTAMTIVASITWISLGFHLLHDGSHYAISVSPKINQGITKLWNALNLWNSKIWFYHHILHHHSFTGMEYRDPDLMKLYPLEMKHDGGDDSKANNHGGFLGGIGGQWVIPFSLFVFPGQYMSQSVSYLLAANTRKYSYISLPDERQVMEFYDPLDLLGMFVTLVSYEIACMKGNFMYLLLFLVSNNILYALNVVLDHDTYENMVTNDYKGKDWLRIQIQHSANFVNDDLLWTRLFGSINYQIEHHLFPNVSSYHYPIIKPIVQHYCLEHNIPYVHHHTLQSAWNSFMKTVRIVQIPTSITPF